MIRETTSPPNRPVPLISPLLFNAARDIWFIKSCGKVDELLDHLTAALNRETAVAASIDAEAYKGFVALVSELCRVPLETANAACALAILHGAAEFNQSEISAFAAGLRQAAVGGAQ